MSKLFRKSLFNFLLAEAVCFCCVFAPRLARAAACCGGGVSVASLITTDDKAQFAASLSQSRVDTDVFSNGVWQKRANGDVTQVLKIETALIFADRYQYGFAVPVQTRRREGTESATSSGFGDVSAQLGYEFLPDWDYNPWRPKGVGFVTLVLPTGKSIYESDQSGGSDTQGRGFLALGLGAAFSKFWGRYDASTALEIHKSFDKSVNSSQLQGVVRPGLGESLSFSAGVSFKDLRMGASLAYVNEEAISVRGSVNSDGSPQQYTTASLSGGYALSDGWAAGLVYSDQTLFGSPTNATLSKSVLASVTKKWAR